MKLPLILLLCSVASVLSVAMASKAVAQQPTVQNCPGGVCPVPQQQAMQSQGSGGSWVSERRGLFIGRHIRAGNARGLNYALDTGPFRVHRRVFRRFASRPQ